MSIYYSIRYLIEETLIITFSLLADLLEALLAENFNAYIRIDTLLRIAIPKSIVKPCGFSSYY